MAGIRITKTSGNPTNTGEISEGVRTMAFDFKKEYKEFYLPKSKPQLVTVPSAP